MRGHYALGVIRAWGNNMAVRLVATIAEARTGRLVISIAKK
jgi:hypothetical protein